MEDIVAVFLETKTYHILLALLSILCPFVHVNQSWLCYCLQPKNIVAGIRKNISE